MLHLAAEVTIGRIGDAAAKLREQANEELPDEIHCDVIANRIVVGDVYHRVDYSALWNTLERDVPVLAEAVTVWARQRGLSSP